MSGMIAGWRNLVPEGGFERVLIGKRTDICAKVQQHIKYYGGCCQI